MNNNLIGRDNEQDSLQKWLESDRSEFVIVYGRRRVGKTYLIKQFFHETYDFSYTGGRKINKAGQLQKFALAIQKYGNLEEAPILSDWSDAFLKLENLLEKLPKEKRKVIFIDEMPWMDSLRSDFVSALEYFWNSWAAMRDDIFFIACGSATSWMVDNIIRNRGGLYNRITHQIYLRPFCLNECEQYLEKADCQWDRYQMLQCYMTFGGIPYYLSLLDPKQSLVQNIDLLFFRHNAPLRKEFDELYGALFNKAENYILIVRVLAEHPEGLSRQQIADSTKIAGGRLTKILKNLEQCDFIIRYGHFDKKKNGEIFRLADFYTIFYFKFVENDNSKDENYWSHHLNSPSIYPWQGCSFELVCLCHLDQIKQALGISGIATAASIWRTTANDEHDGVQIDLLIDRADRIISLCEMKFSKDPYIISKEYAEHVRNRTALFRMLSNTKKGLINTFITTYGVMQGKNSGIVDSEVTMDDLFERGRIR